MICSTALLHGSNAGYSSSAATPSNSFATTSLTAPASATASAGDSSVTVNWTAPATNAGAVGGYRATASPGGATCSTGSATFTCSITGLTNGLDYTVSVVATNGNWTGPATAAAGAYTPYPATIMTGATLNLWLDGADPTTLVLASTCTGGTATSGQTIGCWKDKSANANHGIQSVSTQRPTVSSLNGRSAPDYDGSNDYGTLDVTKLVTGTNPSAIFTVAIQEDTNPTGSDFRHVIGWGATGTGLGRVLEKGQFTTSMYLETFGTWSSMSPTKSWPTGTAVLVDGVITSSNVNSHMNAVTNATYTGAANTGTSAGAAIGATGWNTGGGVWHGRIAEMVILASNPTSTQIRTMREYLARKWAVAITPQAPISPTKNVTGTTATVSWTAPAWNGGAAVTGYTVTPVGGPGSCTWSSGTTASCSGLSIGPTYTFTVAATNSVGTGPTATTP